MPRDCGRRKEREGRRKEAVAEEEREMGTDK